MLDEEREQSNERKSAMLIVLLYCIVLFQNQLMRALVFLLSLWTRFPDNIMNHWLSGKTVRLHKKTNSNDPVTDVVCCVCIVFVFHCVLSPD